MPTDDILPPIAKDQELRTMSILTPREYQQLLSKLPTGQMSMALQSVSHDTLQPSDKTIRDVSVPVNAILTELPETAQTKALSATINTYLGNDFVTKPV